MERRLPKWQLIEIHFIHHRPNSFVGIKSIKSGLLGNYKRIQSSVASTIKRHTRTTSNRLSILILYLLPIFWGNSLFFTKKNDNYYYCLSESHFSSSFAFCSLKGLCKFVVGKKSISIWVNYIKYWKPKFTSSLFNRVELYFLRIINFLRWNQH